MEKVSIIGLDLAKNVFQLHGARADGSVAFRRKLARGKLLEFFASAPPCLVAMPGRPGSVRQRPLLGTGDQGARA